MSFVVRAAGLDDLEAIYRMAKSTGGGFTNLPPDRKTLLSKLDRTATCFARDEESIADDLFVFILEHAPTSEARGTCQVFSQVGANWPFYSYRIGAITQQSKELGRTFRAEQLQLTTDLDGSSEVGGLFLIPGERSGGVGKLLARSRYLFMATHRARFGPRTIAELRGAIDDTGNSAFWDGVAGRFFGMSFREADEFNAVNGNQFIADLMPKHPIYTAMIAESALAVMGVPHTSGRAAMRMLEGEGFRFEHYVDIFDGGPTMIAQTDRIATIQAAHTALITAIEGGGEPTHLVAAGRLAGYRCAMGVLSEDGEVVTLDPDCAELLGVAVGDPITFVPR
jgi:arginine N-succinyltransferase